MTHAESFASAAPLAAPFFDALRHPALLHPSVLAMEPPPPPPPLSAACAAPASAVSAVPPAKREPALWTPAAAAAARYLPPTPGLSHPPQRYPPPPPPSAPRYAAARFGPPMLAAQGAPAAPHMLPPHPQPAPAPARTGGRSGGRRAARAKFQCGLCPSTFSRKDNLKTHQRLHSGEMPFTCAYCGRRFRWQSSARTHEQVHERHGHRKAVVPPTPAAAPSAQVMPASAAMLVRAAAGNMRSPVGSTGGPSPTIRKRRAASAPSPAALDLDLDRLLGDAVGLANEPAPAPVSAGPPAISPMFSLPSLSQQDLENALEQNAGAHH